MYYSENIKRYDKEYQKLNKLKRIFFILRAVSFIFSLIFGYKIIETGSSLFIVIFASFIILFLFAVKFDIGLTDKMKYIKNLLNINNKEIDFLTKNKNTFHNGAEYIDFNHPFSFDIDIFGENSLFHYLNRTISISGKIKLAEKLSFIQKDKQTIIELQEAVEELSNMSDFRQYFAATGMLNDISSEISSKTDINKINILKWASSPNIFLNNKIWKYLRIIFPGIFAVLFVVLLLGYIPFNVLLAWGLVQISVVGIYTKKINAEHNQLSKKHDMLSVFQKLITISESEEFKSKYLKNLTKDFYEKDNTARLLLKNFNNSLKAFDSRLNILVAITFNMAAMWDIQNMLRLENLKQKLNNHLPVWFNIIAEIDALNSFANFNFNNPEYVFPTIEKENFKLKIKSGGHPLIDKQNRIDNDFEISGLGKITIITGANMAGKSTFLRTVGVNMLLASTGAKVCAKEFIFKPTDIYTSVRTNDSLSKNESYFYSELMRLKKIIDKLKSDEELFVIIDEMLRGTNSNDKHKGSQGLIEQLIKYKVTGLVATHDVLLGNMKNDYPKNIDTKKFEVDIVENDISFDYKLKDGVSQNLNATFLMKKYGIIE